MMMVDDGGGRGVKNGQKSDDVINGRPQMGLDCKYVIYIYWLISFSIEDDTRIFCAFE